MAPKLLRQNPLLKQGQPLYLEGQNTLRLDDPGRIWLVQAGEVDLFAVDAHSGYQHGAREHLHRAGVGEALFGMDLSDYENQLSIIAVGLPGTAVVETSIQALHEMAANSESQRLTALLLEGWIIGLTQTFAGTSSPRAQLKLSPSSQTEMEAGMAAHNDSDEVVWLQISGNEVFQVEIVFGSFPSSREIDEKLYIPVGATYPLPSCAWMLAHKPVTLRIMDTKEALQQRVIWPALEEFHQVVLRRLVVTQADTAHSERERITQKFEFSGTYLHNAITDLASILAPTIASRDRATVAVGEQPDPLLTACRLVGDRLGVRVQPVPDPVDGTVEEQTLTGIAQASRLGKRRVILRDEWWTADNGPLLAYRNEDERPVALLPTSPSSYSLHDPTLGSITAVDQETAHSLSPIAVSFYRALPDRPLKLLDLIRFIWPDLKSDARMIMWMGVAGGMLALLLPLLTALIFDKVLPGGQRGQLVQIGLALALSTLMGTAFNLTRGVALLRAEGKASAALSAAVWERLVSMPTNFFRRYTVGDLANRALNIETIRRELSGTVLSAILSGLFSVFSFMLLFYFSVPLALVATVLVVLLVGLTTYIGLAETGYRRQISKLDGRLSGWALQFLSGISKLRTTGAEDKAFALWARDYSQRTRLSYKLGLLNNNLSVFMGAYPLLTLMAIFAVIGFSIRSDLSTGSFLAFNAAFSQFLNSVLGLSGAVVGALRVVPLYERAQPILEAVPETDPTRVEPGTLSGSIEVGHISFKYQDDLPLVLDDVSLRIQTGQFIALVGPSGSGKSTLFRLLMGFETPTAGAIYYGNLSLTTLNLHSVRQQLGVVLQNGKLMPGDILTNIIGVSNLTTDDAWEAARMAGLAEDIEAMPMGMHTVVGMGGTTFSGGQKQRLLIARAIVRKPRILFFDEATSALDNQTQDVVRSSLDSLATTRVVIAHRLSTIVNADHIYVLQRGQLVQQGTYEELIVQEGLFATLVKRQLT